MDRHAPGLVPRSEIDRRPVAFGEPPQHGGVKQVFLHQNPRRQRRLGIAGQHRHAGLSQHRAVIQHGRHLMHGAAGRIVPATVEGTTVIYKGRLL